MPQQAFLAESETCLWGTPYETGVSWDNLGITLCSAPAQC